jgi:predicted dehydrogenase
MKAEALASLRDACSLPESVCFDDAATMLTKTQPHLVMIATTAPSHAALTVMAAMHGASHILCEKPMAQSLEQCDTMMVACEKAGVTLAINHQMRFMEQYTIPKAMLASEAHGGLASIHATAGNFGMAMNGTHYLEMARYMSDAEPSVIWAKFSSDDVPNPRGEQFRDKAGWLRMEMTNGIRFSMEVGSDQGHGLCVNYASRYGQIFVDELTGDMREIVREADKRELPTTRYGLPHHVHTRKITPADSLAPTRSVLQALLNGKHYPTGRQSRLALAALVAAYISDAKGGAPVSIAEAEARKNEAFPWA